MSKTANKIANDVLKFLDKQQLDPTPQNYAVGYYHVTGINSALSRSITNITDDGYRLTQVEADKLADEHNLNLGNVQVVKTKVEDKSSDLMMSLVRHQMLQLADITSNQNEATSQFGRDLTANAERMQSNPEILQLLNAMIERTAQAEKELAKTSKEAEKLKTDLDAALNDAHIDALTNLPNRRSIDATLRDMEKAGENRVIAFCDIDKFKRINDTYGHAVGDRVLQSVSEILKEECEEYGMVARWGGEEFVIVFKNKTVDEAAKIVDQARLKLNQKTFRLRQTDEPMGVVSFSAGIAEGRGKTEEITAQADALLYQAKEQGRNRILTQ
jgi:diguanylate cyclase